MQQIVDELSHAVRANPDSLQNPAAGLGNARVELGAEHFAKPLDRAQGLTQVVRDGVRKGLEIPVGDLEIARALAYPQLELLIHPPQLGDERRGLERRGGGARQNLESLELSGADALLRSRGAEAQDAEELSAGDDRQGDSNPAVKRMREEHARIAIPCVRLELPARLSHPLLAGSLEQQCGALQRLGAGPGLSREAQCATVVSGDQ